MMRLLEFVKRKRQRRYRSNGEDWIWFQFAREVSENSTCVRRQVGAVLVNPLHGLVSFGWNIEAGHRDCAKDCPRGQHSHSELPAAAPFSGPGTCIATHAEITAIERSETLTMDQMRGCRMYITHRPCSGCEEVLRTLGITFHFEKEYG